MGCALTAAIVEGKVISVAGNSCKRGEEYAVKECTAPERIVTTTVPLQGGRGVVPVKTRTAIPKGQVPACIKALRGIALEPPVYAGDVVLPDVCGTGVDVVATREILRGQ